MGRSKLCIGHWVVGLIVGLSPALLLAEQAPPPTTSPPDGTASWKTYRNEQFAFEIQYPEGWGTHEMGGGVVIRNDGGKTSLALQISYLKGENPAQSTLGQWLDAYFGPRWFVDAVRTSTTIDGSGAIRFKWNRPDWVGRYDLYVAHGSDIVNVIYRADDVEQGTVFHNMLATFKFVQFDSTRYLRLQQEERKVLGGEDRDGDGVWDYVESYIEQHAAHSQKTRAALQQYARALQASLVDYRDVKASIEHAHERLDALDCLRYIHPHDNREIFNDLRAAILNTMERSRAYIQADSHMSGQIIEDTPDGLMKSKCQFDPETMEN